MVFSPRSHIPKANSLAEGRCCNVRLSLLLLIEKHRGLELGIKEFFFLQHDLLVLLHFGLRDPFGLFLGRRGHLRSVFVGNYSRFVAGFGILFLFLRRFFRLVVLFTVILIIAFVLLFWLVVLADSHESLV